MDFNEIGTMISTVGFPIVACIALYLQSKEQNKSISDLSLALQKLSDKIETMQRQIRREPQLNRQMAMNGEARAMKQQLAELKKELDKWNT